MATEIIHTIGTGARDYTSFTAWQAAQVRDLVAANEIEIAECYNDGVLTDSFTITGWTTDTDHYIKIYTPAGQRHQGYLDSGFRLNALTAGFATIAIYNPYVWIEGLEIHSYSQDLPGILGFVSGVTGWVKITKNLFGGLGRGVFLNYNTAVCTYYIWNNAFVGQTTIPAAIYVSYAAIPTYIYANSSCNCRGIRVPISSNTIAKNNACLYTTTSGYDFDQKSYFAANSCNNASTLDAVSLYGAPGANSVYDALSGDNYYSSTILRIKSTSVLRNAGADLSSDIYWPFSDDIEGNARGSTWDIGAFKFALPTEVTSTVGTNGALRDYTSLIAWEAQNLNLPGKNQIEIAECYNDGAMTGNVVIAGWTTINECYIKIYTPQAQRHTGLRNTGFRVSGLGTAHTITVNIMNVWIEGLSLTNASTSYYGVYFNVASGSLGWFKYSYNICYACAGIAFNDAPTDSIAYVWNNFTFTCTYGFLISEVNLNVYLYGNSVYNNSTRGFAAPATNNKVRVKDNVALTNGGANNYDFYLTSYFHADSDYNCSTASNVSTSRAPGANSLFSKLAMNNFLSIVVGSEDLHVKDENADIHSTGISLSDDAYLAFSIDIDGELRTPWSIGADGVELIITETDIVMALPYSVKINGRDLREFGIELTRYPAEALMPPIRERLQEIDGHSGSRDFGSLYENWTFSIVGQIRGTSHRDLVEKKTAFLRWIDMQQHHISEWLVGQETVCSLKLELSGHRYFYRKGTVTATADSFTITGSSTRWTSFLKPLSEFRISSVLHPRYTIASVDSATQLKLGHTSEVSGSGLTYEAERKRFLLVNYAGSSDISNLSAAFFRDIVTNISISFRTTYPYWLGDKFVYEESNTSAGAFVELYGVGTAINNPIYQIVGPATNPEVCACECAFVALFDGNSKARTILNKTDVTSADAPNDYRPTKNNKGIYITSPNTCSYANAPGYKDKFSFVARLKMGFAYNGVSDSRYVFDYYYNGNNGFQLYYNGLTYNWVLNIRSGGSDNTTLKSTDNSPAFSINDNIEASGWYDSDGRDIEGTTYYGKIFIDGIETGSITACPTPPTSNPYQLYIGSLAAGTNQIDSTVDEIGLFVVALTDQDLVSIFNDGDPIINNNATCSYSGTLAADDILTINTGNGESELFVASTKTRTYNSSNITGFSPSLRGNELDELAMLYLPAAIGGKIRVVQRPHFR